MRKWLRRWLPYIAVIVGATVAVYLAPSNEGRSIRKTIERRGTPCIAVEKTREQPKGVPSEGCFRLFGLLMQVCDERPKQCAQTARRALRSQPRLFAVGVLDAIGELGDGSSGAAGGRDGDGGGGGGAPPGGGTLPGVPPGSSPPGRVPPGGGGGGGGSPPSGGGPPPDPGPGGVNDTLRGTRDALNDVTEGLGLGRPVPPLPQVPRLVPPGLLLLR